MLPRANIEQCANSANGSSGNPPPLTCLTPIAGVVINLAFFLLGAACVIFLIKGSITLILSAGNEKSVQQGKQTITYAIFGTVLVLSSYIIIRVIIQLISPDLNLLEFSIGE